MSLFSGVRGEEMLSCLNAVSAHIFVPFVSVTLVVHAVAFGADDTDHDGRVEFAMPSTLMRSPILNLLLLP